MEWACLSQANAGRPVIGFPLRVAVMAVMDTNPRSSDGKIEPPDQRPLPTLSRDALHRIAQAEKQTRELYDVDKWPHFPRNPDFSFLETSLRRAMYSILAYLTILAEEVLDA